MLGLSLLIIGPGLLAGWENLRQAEQAMGEGRFAAAASNYIAAAQRLPWQPALWERAAQAALSSGDPQAAIPLFERAEDKNALSPQGWLAWGDAYQQSGDIASARATWQAGIVQHGPSAALFARLARAYRLQGDYPAAITAWRALLDLDVGDADAHYQLGLLLAATAPELALPELMQAARLDPGLDASVQGLRASLNAALLVDNRPYQLLMSGRALAALGEWELAAEAFLRAVAARRDYAEAWAWLGEARQHLGADGLPDLQRALLLDPDSPGVNALVGLYWQRQGRADQALAYFRTTMRLEPGNAAWHVAAASAAEQSGDLVAALAYYKQAVALDPKGAAYWRSLAAFCARYQVEVNETGLPAARRLLALAPQDWRSQDVMGQVAEAASDPLSAEKYYLGALELAPEQAAPHFHLGVLYLQLGQAQSAYDNLVKTQRLDPDGPYGWQARRLLERYFP